MEQQIFQQSSNHNKILHATVQNLDAQAIWHPHSIHCWYHIFYLPISRWYISLPLAFTDHINKHSLHLKDLQVKSMTHHDPTKKNSRPHQPKYHVMPHHELTWETSYSGSSHIHWLEEKFNSINIWHMTACQCLWTLPPSNIAAADSLLYQPSSILINNICHKN